MGVAILVNANIDLPALTLVGRTILADFAAAPPPTCAVDLDGDNDTDVFDFGVFAATFGSVFGDAAFNPGADLDDSGAIDVLDFGAFAAAFGCPN
jgi:hypothetical protein